MSQKDSFFSPEDFTQLGDPRDWPIYPQNPRRDRTQGGINAVSRPRFWKMIDGVMEEEIQRRRRQGPGTN